MRSTRRPAEITTGTTYRELNALLDHVAQHPEAAADATDVQLLRLQHRWTTALAARLDQTLEAGGPVADEVAGVWRGLAAETPALRSVLDAGEDRLAGAARRELRTLALAAGLATLDDPAERAERLGRALRTRVREARPLAHVA
ncbi:MAG TPA: hypothetical protein VGH99_22370 [Pseudonocardia sp.]|jgi:hypothetical protein